MIMSNKKRLRVDVSIEENAANDFFKSYLKINSKNPDVSYGRGWRGKAVATALEFYLQHHSP